MTTNSLFDNQSNLKNAKMPSIQDMAEQALQNDSRRQGNDYGPGE